MKAAIIGLGLIGGSLGLNLVKNKFISTVYGCDINASHLDTAIKLGIVHDAINLADIACCDLIFIATPVDATLSIIKNLPKLKPTTSVVEFGSTKYVINEHIPAHLREQFILAHPMAGTEHSGPQAAKEDLFKGAVCVICDAEYTAVAHQHRIIELLSSMQMKITFMNVKEHDYRSAIISHLPHVISFALANYVLSYQKPEHIVHLAGGSFADMSRIAKSSPAMWQSIFSQNKPNVLEALNGFINELEHFKKLLEQDDSLLGWMQEANRLKDIL